MPRGKRNLTLQEKLNKITSEIEIMKQSLKEMENTKKELEEQIKAAEIEDLYAFIAETGLTIKEVKDRILEYDS